MRDDRSVVRSFSGSALLVGGLLLVLASSKKGEDSSVTPNSQPAETITAAELDKVYQENEVNADSRFKGKLLLVSGTVGDISKDFTDDMILTLKGENLIGVRAYVSDADKAAVANVKKGQSVSVICKGDGMMVGSPVLKGCRLK